MIRATNAFFEISAACVYSPPRQSASGSLFIEVSQGCFCITGSISHNHGSAANAIPPTQLLVDADSSAKSPIPQSYSTAIPFQPENTLPIPLFAVSTLISMR
jgi:hypothetical protein